MSIGQFAKDLLSGIVELGPLIDNRDQSEDITINIIGSEGEPIAKKNGDEIIAEVPVSSIRETDQVEFREKIREGFEDGKVQELVKASNSKKYSTVKESLNSEDIKEIKDFFSDNIKIRHKNMLEAALHYRKLCDKAEIDTDELNADIQEKYGEEGIKLKNLVVAGYMDEGGYVRQLYRETDEDEQFEEIFEEIVRLQPFTVFVSQYKDLDETYNELIRKVRQYKKNAVDFVDIRGIGNENRDKINDCIELLEEKFGDFDYNEREESGELRVRIDPKTSEWKTE